MRLTTQFLGTIPGPLQDVSIDSGGPVKVTVDGKVHPGQQAHLVVTGDVQLDVTGPGEAMAPVLVEIDRLRDLVGPPEDFKIVAADGDTATVVAASRIE